MKKFIRRILIILIVALFIFGNNYRKVNEPKISEPVIKEDSSLTKDERLKQIYENKSIYPKELLEMLEKNTDMTDFVYNYQVNKGKVFANDIGKVEKNTVPLLLQYDERWGYGMYGDEVLAINGCGPTSVAMVIAGLTGRNIITPYDVASYAYENGYYKKGTRWNFFTEGVKNYGIVGKEIPLVKSKIFKELELGHPIICSMRKGDFTTTGHLIVLVGVKNGKLMVNDPNSRERSERLWSYERLESQIKNLWSFRTY